MKTHLPWGAVLSIIMLPIVMFVASVWLSVNIAERKSMEQDFRREQGRCGDLALEIEVRTQVPPPSKVAQALVDAYSRRYQELGCPTLEEKRP